ncbi:hypothetical protein QQZ08_002748 [Neonectria magnoliae]|uniref:TauD/TfdA-like domain-containing protein n=1 Tax=Neonectria magnoliae TaxID=2732573 RepID=A0ABR1IAS5_9HYPO
MTWPHESPLTSDWRYAMKKQQGVRVINQPVIACVDGKVQINLATAFLKGFGYISRQADNDIRVLLQACRKYCMALRQAVSDMLLVNNLSVLHARDSFVDDPGAGKTRRFMSAMLRDPELAWRKPTNMANEMGKKFAKLESPQFIGTVEQYEEFRDKFVMLRHD